MRKLYYRSMMTFSFKFFVSPPCAVLIQLTMSNIQLKNLWHNTKLGATQASSRNPKIFTHKIFMGGWAEHQRQRNWHKIGWNHNHHRQALVQLSFELLLLLFLNNSWRSSSLCRRVVMMWRWHWKREWQRIAGRWRKTFTFTLVFFLASNHRPNFNQQNTNDIGRSGVYCSY